jgi:pyruvate dehydrogenase E2 component (dihydrolipoamide acetyltransferase)
MPNKSKAEQKREKLADRSVPVGRIRAVVAKRLTDSLHEAPHFFLRSAVEADRLIALRSALNEGRDEGSKISLNTLFAKLSAAAIVRNPDINSSWKGETIEYRKSVDVALAVALPEGLIAPVVRDCANKGLDEMEQEFRALIAKAKAGGLKPEDYEGATFTISNLGAWGVEEFTAIINPPGSAILALGAIAKEPVVRPSSSGNDEIVIRSILRATLSCDHRVIDGAVGAAFLRDLKAFFEEPSRALL